MAAEEAVKKKSKASGLSLQLRKKLTPVQLLASAGFSIPKTLFRRVILSSPRNSKWSLREEVGVSVLRSMMPDDLSDLRSLGKVNSLLFKKLCREKVSKVKKNVVLWDDRLYDYKIYTSVMDGILPDTDFHHFQKIQLHGYWIGEEHRHADEVVILYSHGGGFVMGDALMNGMGLSDLLKRLRKTHGVKARVFSVEYPLSPAAKFPEALNMVYAAYLYLNLVYKAKKIVIGGDSAGGNLALTCLIRQRMHNKLVTLMDQSQMTLIQNKLDSLRHTPLNTPKQDIPFKPAATLLLSPLVYVGLDDYKHIASVYLEKGSLDYLKPCMASKCIYSYTGIMCALDDKKSDSTSNASDITLLIEDLTLSDSSKLKESDSIKFNFNHPLVSPIKADYSNWDFGPIYLQAGGAEILNNDHTRFISYIQSFQESNGFGPVIIEDIEPEMIHAFTLMQPFLGKKPAEALKRCAEFIAHLT